MVSLSQSILFPFPKATLVGDDYGNYKARGKLVLKLLCKEAGVR
jgi:hypothetical protein